MKKLIFFFSIIFLFFSCKKDEDPKQDVKPNSYNLEMLVDQVFHVDLYGIFISEDSKYILIATKGPEYNSIYSDDGGNTYKTLGEDFSFRAASFSGINSIDNNGYISFNGDGFGWDIKSNQLINVTHPDSRFQTKDAKAYAYSFGQSGGKIISAFYTQSNNINFKEFNIPQGFDAIHAIGLKEGGVLLFSQDYDHYLFFNPETNTRDSGLTNIGNISDIKGSIAQRILLYSGRSSNIIIGGPKGFVKFNFINKNSEKILFSNLANINGEPHYDIDNSGNVYLSFFVNGQIALAKIVNNSLFMIKEASLGEMKAFAIASDKIIFNGFFEGAKASRTIVISNLNNEVIGEKLFEHRNTLLLSGYKLAGGNVLLSLNDGLYIYNTSQKTLNKRFNFPEIIYSLQISAEGNWVCGALNKVYVSSDQGNTWDTIRNVFGNIKNASNINIYRIKKHGNTLHAIGFGGFNFTYGDGYSKSIDGGKTWTPISIDDKNFFTPFSVTSDGTYWGFAADPAANFYEISYFKIGEQTKSYLFTGIPADVNEQKEMVFGLDDEVNFYNALNGINMGLRMFSFSAPNLSSTNNNEIINDFVFEEDGKIRANYIDRYYESK